MRDTINIFRYSSQSLLCLKISDVGILVKYLISIFPKYSRNIVRCPGKKYILSGDISFALRTFSQRTLDMCNIVAGGGGECEGRGAKEVGEEETRFLVLRKDRERHFLTDTYSSPDVVSFEVHPPMFAATKTKTTTRRDDAPESERATAREKEKEREQEGETKKKKTDGNRKEG